MSFLVRFKWKEPWHVKKNYLLHIIILNLMGSFRVELDEGDEIAKCKMN